MKQFIAPKVLKVNGQPSPCECAEGVVCAYCVQANLILWERKEGGKVDAQGASIIALREAIKKRGLRGVARELGVDHKAVTDWIKKKNVPERYLRNGDLMGKEAVSA
jgi:hypothetical protein